MKRFLLLAFMLSATVSCFSKGLYETYRYDLMLFGESGIPLINQEVTIIGGNFKNVYTTNQKGVISLQIAYSTKCSSTLNTFERIFNNRPEWSSKHLEIEYQGFHRSIRKNWKRVFRNRTMVEERFSVVNKRFVK